MRPSFDIVVAGAGVVGLTVAALLASGESRRRPRLTVVDAGAEPQFDPTGKFGLRVAAMSAGSMQVFARLGVRQAIPPERAGAYRDMRVWDAPDVADGAEALRFGAAEMALPELGFIVENALLQHLLLERLRALGVELRFEAAIDGIEERPGRHELTLADGSTLVADLLIGADGAKSGVRRLCGIAVSSRSYEQTAVVAHLTPERPHRHTAWQRFLPDGPLALLPLADGRVSVVCSTTPEHAARLLAADDDAFGAALTGASDQVLGHLQADGARASFPLYAQHAVHYVQQGIALIGDAAHTVHPLAGQGANLGVADAACLADAIDTALAGDDYPADLRILRRYERARHGANQTMLTFIDALSRLFAADHGLLTRLRGNGMRLFNHSGPLRRHAVNVALGLDAGTSRAEKLAKR